MKRMLLPMLSCALLLGCSDRSSALLAPDEPLFAAITQTQSFTIPVSITAFVPCAAGGAGEIVQVSGPLHIVTHTTLDGAGGVHVSTHFQPQGISGVGLTTGDTYHATGVTRENVNLQVGAETTFVNNFRIIGQGPDNNLLIHQLVHLTVNANGTVTADVVQTSIECR